MADSAKVKITKDGPYRVSGDLPLGKEIITAGKDDIPVKWSRGERYPQLERYSLCRCGHSVNKPYCTGMHSEVGFDGTEIASRKKHSAQSKKTAGAGIDLLDAVAFCSSARFCDFAAGAWESTSHSKDPKSKKLAIREACDCPSGRLVMIDKRTKKAIEPKFKQSISIIEDPGANASGPIWVKGGVQIESADGKMYEIRNRVTLCRCGKSENKPFCDGTHIEIRFNDGDSRVKK